MVKRQLSEWEKIIANKARDKELISKIYKRLLQLNSSTVPLKYSTARYITAAFTLDSRHPGLEIKLLHYCAVYHTAQQRTQKHNHL